MKRNSNLPPEPGAALSEIAAELEKSRTFVLAAHSRPDGDTAGSELALYSFLTRRGKKVSIYSKHPLPEMYSFLPNASRIKTTDSVEGFFDVVIILECPDLSRTGEIIDLKKNAGKSINLDHHAGFSLYADINCISPESAAVSELVYDLILKSGDKPTAGEALCLYVGILTDTSAFQQANVTPRTFEILSELLKYGLDMEDIKGKIYGNCRPEAIRFLGNTLLSLKLYEDGKIAVLEITAEDFKKFSATEDDLEGVIDHARKVRGVKVACLFREIPGGDTDKIKVSFRSDGSVDLNAFAGQFGGGGHKRAAGCTIPGPLAKSREKILSALKEKLKQ